MPKVSNWMNKPYTRPAPRPQGADGQWLHDRAPGVPRAVSNSAPKPATRSTNTRIIVSNLHYEVTSNDLSQIFGQIGTLVREPHIRYDRSGRSSGVAVITYETPAEATRAKELYDGILCKNQPMSIHNDTSPPAPKGARRSGASPLINRIGKPSLLDRLSKYKSASVMQNSPLQGGVGPLRARARGGAPSTRPSKQEKPKTMEELDEELEMFMKDDITAAPTAPQAAEGDVDMA